MGASRQALFWAQCGLAGTILVSFVLLFFKNYFFLETTTG